MKHITDENFEEFLGGKDGRVKALKMSAVWCEPCKMMDEVMPDVIKAFPNVDWGKADIDDTPKLAKQFKIMTIPHILFFKNGKQLKQKIDGFGGKEDLLRKIKRIVK